jgi:hypothetical protein
VQPGSHFPAAVGANAHNAAAAQVPWVGEGIHWHSARVHAVSRVMPLQVSAPPLQENGAVHAPVHSARGQAAQGKGVPTHIRVAQPGGHAMVLITGHTPCCGLHTGPHEQALPTLPVQFASFSRAAQTESELPVPVHTMVSWQRSMGQDPTEHAAGGTSQLRPQPGAQVSTEHVTVLEVPWQLSMGVHPRAATQSARVLNAPHDAVLTPEHSGTPLHWQPRSTHAAAVTWPPHSGAGTQVQPPPDEEPRDEDESETRELDGRTVEDEGVSREEPGPGPDVTPALEEVTRDEAATLVDVVPPVDVAAPWLLAPCTEPERRHIPASDSHTSPRSQSCVDSQ